MLLDCYHQSNIPIDDRIECLTEFHHTDINKTLGAGGGGGGGGGMDKMELFKGQ